MEYSTKFWKWQYYPHLHRKKSKSWRQKKNKKSNTMAKINLCSTTKPTKFNTKKQVKKISTLEKKKEELNYWIASHKHTSSNPFKHWRDHKARTTTTVTWLDFFLVNFYSISISMAPSLATITMALFLLLAHMYTNFSTTKSLKPLTAHYSYTKLRIH